ncbi:MAG TPA: DinB family protein [Pyrinomonadaceae bacterium]
MTIQISIQALREPLLKCLDETFSNNHGIFLDKGTTLFQTLETVTAAEASEKISPNSATIAAQVEHLRFYLDVLDNYIHKREDTKVNWREIWDTVSTVNDEEWKAVKQRLRESHERVMTTINSFEQWDSDFEIGAALAILTHTAYHLGGIRTTLGTIRGKSELKSQI